MKRDISQNVRRKRTMTIRAKVVGIFVLTLIVTSVLNLFLISRIVKKDYKLALHSELLTLGKNLETQIKRITALGISTRDIEGFGQQCTELVTQNENVTEAMVIDTEGTIIFHNNPSFQDTVLPYKNIVESLNSPKTKVYSISQQKNNMYFAVTPFGDSPDYLEYAVVVASPAKIINHKIIILINKCNAVLVTTFTLAALLLLFSLTTIMVSPLALILKTMKDITKSKDLQKRVNITSTDEIGQIADAFNTLTADLQISTTSIDNLNREIAERKRVEQRLGLTQFSVDNCPDSILRTEPDGAFSYANNAACEMFGYSRQEMLSLHVWDADTSISEENWQEHWKNIKQAGSLAFESFSKTRNSRIFPAEVVVYYVDFHGRQCAYVFARDISERKKAEYEIRETDIRFKQIVNNASEWIWEVDAKGLYTYSSPIVEELLGYKLEEVVGKKYFYDFFLPEEKEELRDAALAGFAEKKPFKGFLNANVHKDGHTIWFMTSGVPIVNEDGNLVGYRGSDIDITERKRAEEEIQKSREVLLQIIDSMPFGVMVVGMDKIIKRANTTAQKLTGYCEAELVGRLCHDTLCPAERDACPIIDKKQQLDASEKVLVTKDGQNIPILKTVVQIRLGDEDVLIEAFVDIVQLKEAQQGREEAMTKLEEANQNLKEFVYVASHDLREPLRKIIAFGQMLQESLGPKLGPDDAESLGYMVDGAERMSDMIEGLLAYSRVNTKKHPFKPVNLNEIVEQINNVELSVLVEENNVTLEVPEKLLPVYVDPVQIRQLLQNLIANGIKYQPKDNAPHITITSRPAADGMVKIQVADNGIGIAPEYHQTVFAMFRRLHTKNEYEGTGIGLAVCKKIVERHSGEIGVESQPGQGSIFWFTVPATEVAVPVEA